MKFLIKEISSTRKELRLILSPSIYNNINYYGFGTTGGNFDEGSINIESIPFEELNYYSLGPNPAHIRLITAYLKDTLGSSFGSLNTLLTYKNTNYNEIPIVNIVVDDINLETLSSDTVPSLIVKLLAPLPSPVNLLTEVSIEKQILSTQEQEVYYVSAEEPPAIIRGLDYDSGLISEIEDKEFKKDVLMSYDEITGSLQQSDDSLINLSLTGSNNLKIDYNDFSNHVHFGSAVSKIENFKTKLSQIEDSLFLISQSLNTGSISLSDPSEVDSVIQLRKHQFKNIEVIKSNFTDFEKYFYYNSDKLKYKNKVGIGVNYASPLPLNNSTKFTNNSGFGIIHKVSGSTSGSGKIDLFVDKYKVEDKPFYNHSGSFYLSFLMRGDESINGNIKWDNVQKENIPMYPKDTLYTSSILQPDIKSGSWQRYVYLASSSYWAPHSSNPDIGYVNTITDFEHGSSEVTLLSGSAKTGSYTITAGGRYTNLSTNVTSSGIPFTGSIVPAGELFRLYVDTNNPGNEITSSFITDIKITKKNPLNSLPFSEIYSTGSSEFTNWYNEMYASASDYDSNNVHSLLSTLPEYLSHDNIMDNTDLRKFVNLMGEQYDEAKSYIDGTQNLINTQYGEVGSVPENMLSVVASKNNWDFNVPFGDPNQTDFVNFFGSNPSSLNSTSNVQNNIWRNIINNLRYIYKSKGTNRSIRALLNSYGFPPDILKIKEHGASMDKFEDTILNENEENIIDGLGGSSGSVSYIQKEDKLVSYVFDSKERLINADWGVNADNSNAFEFVMRPASGTDRNIIVNSSGSLSSGSLWDIVLEASASDNTKSRLTFRLNNSTEGSSSLEDVDTRISMSTNYLDLKNQNFWNVLLQRTSGPTPPVGLSVVSHSYSLYVGEQVNDKITNFDVVSMTVGGTEYSKSAANWQGTGSRPAAVGGNLTIGSTYTGSLAEIRTWKTPLSASKFKQHILDKKSTVGNHITASQTDLIYHYRLNENWLSGASNPKIKDSNPNGPKSNPKNYTIPFSDVMTGSLNDRPLYDTDTFERIQFNVGIGGAYEVSDNNIIIDSERRFIDNLNPKNPSVMNVYHPLINKRKASSVLELTRSPQEVINDFILNQLGNYDFNDLFADPADINEPNYRDLEKFSKEFLDYYEISLDVNKFIRAQTKIFTKDLIDSLKKLVPARADFSKVGVELKPSFFDRQKIQNEKLSKEILSFEGTLPFTDWEKNKYSLTTIVNLEPVKLTKDAHLELASVTGSSQGYYDFTNKYELHESKNAHIELASVTGSSQGYYDFTEQWTLHKTKDAEIAFSTSTGSEHYTFTNEYVPSKDAHIAYSHASGSEYWEYSNELFLPNNANIELASHTGSSQGYYDFTNKYELHKTKDGHIELASVTGSDFYDFTNLYELHKTKDAVMDISSDSTKSFYKFTNLIPLYEVRSTHIEIASSTGSVPDFTKLEPLHRSKDTTLDISSDTNMSVYRFNNLVPLYNYRDTHIELASATGSVPDFTKLEPLHRSKDTELDISSDSSNSFYKFNNLIPLYSYRDTHISIASATGSVPDFTKLEPLYSSKDTHISIASATGSIPNINPLEKLYDYKEARISVASSTGSVSWNFTELEPLHISNDTHIEVTNHSSSKGWSLSKNELLYDYKDTHISVASSTGSVSWNFTELEKLHSSKNTSMNIASSTGSVSWNFTSLEKHYSSKDAHIEIASHTGSVPLLSSTENLYEYNKTKLPVASHTGSVPNIGSSMYEYRVADLDTQFNNDTGSKTFTNEMYDYQNSQIAVATTTSSKPMLTSEISLPKVGTFDFVGNKTFYEKLNESYTKFDSDWGIGENKTHFIHYGNPGKLNDYNTYHYETRYIFHAIGDIEFISGSYGDGDKIFQTDFTGTFVSDANYTGSQDFKNKTFVKTNEVLGFRPLGTTMEFKPESAVSYGGKYLDGTFVYPPNHSSMVGSSKDTIDRLIYKGTQNSGGETLESLSFTDLDTKAFYTILTTGNQGYTVTNDY